MTARAPAKINVCLFVGGARASDGRHELVSVMQSIDLADELRLGAASGGGGDEVVCPGVEGDNIVTAAIAAFRARTGWDGPPVRITVTKRIPVAAGMAGGSADAAATLRLLARAAGVEDPALLREIGGGLGADVPAQVEPGRHLATGAGEQVQPLSPVWPDYAVLVLPSDDVLSTPAVYGEFDRLGLARDAGDLAARLDEVRTATARRGGALPAALAVNDLEPAAISLLPSVGDALTRLRDAGADRAVVSGSGPTALGLFADRGAARAAAQSLRRDHPRLVLTEPVATAAARGA
jgi:4-diphosphocytidyl-2-C-methyl-D-erythritol kinase